MSEIQQNIEWYVATLVMEIRVESATCNVVHKSLHLIAAASPDEAYGKALRLGHECETSYENPAGRVVKHCFRGLARLELVVDGELFDGAELTFWQHVGVSDEQIREWVKAREQLRAFRTPEPQSAEVPDYSSRDCVEPLP